MMKKFLIALLFLVCPDLIAQNTLKVACVGNSITQGPGREHPDSFPLQMQKLLGEDYEVKNFGVSGRTLLKKGDFPYWEEPQFEQVKDFSPDILVIKMGTNDSKPQNWKNKEDFKKDYIDLITTYKKHMPQNGEIYVCLPVPVFEDNYGITSSIIVNEMTPMLKEIAKETGAKIIDLNKPLKKKASLFPDGIHPNKEGGKIMAEIVAKHILQIGR